MQVHWIWYAGRKLSEQCRRMLLEYFYDAEDIYASSEEKLRQIPDMTEDTKVKFEAANYEYERAYCNV